MNDSAMPPTRPASSTARPTTAMARAATSPSTRSATCSRSTTAASSGSACTSLPPLLDKLQEEFGLHDLAIEDAHARAPAAEDRGLRRFAVRGDAHGAGRGKPHPLRRDLCLPRRALPRDRAPWRFAVVRAGARAGASANPSCSRSDLRMACTRSWISSSTITCRSRPSSATSSTRSNRTSSPRPTGARPSSSCTTSSAN